jgi:hypothetical protein
MKIGRNELCSCDSGKKYKKCCLEHDKELKEKRSIYDEYKILNDEKFKRATGVARALFEIMAGIIEISLQLKHQKGGRKPKLTTEDILLLMLTYYRDYTTFYKTGLYFQLDESNAYRWIKWCEEKLQVAFAGTINITEIDIETEHAVDVMECPIQRPKNNEIQRLYYSGKKKRHTMKIQIIMDINTKKIDGIEVEKGSVHDFQLFKDSSVELNELLKFIGDSGYQGILDFFKNSITPKKKSKHNPLTDEDKELNKLISSIRIAVEHINCQLKIFKILAERYRNGRHTFHSRALLICCFYNFCL